MEINKSHRNTSQKHAGKVSNNDVFEPMLDIGDEMSNGSYSEKKSIKNFFQGDIKNKEDEYIEMQDTS